MSIIEDMKWRYATKKFDKSKKLDQKQLNLLLGAANLAPSSYGLQPFQLLVIENRLLREKLKEFSYGQPQVTDASHLIVFAVRNNLSETDVESYIDRIAQNRNVPVSSLASYKATIMSSIRSKSAEQLFQWASRQAYISLGFLLAAAANEKIDACPMEGFQKDKYDELLGLKEKGLSSMVMAAVGYRAEDDDYQYKPKVRKTLDEIVMWYV